MEKLLEKAIEIATEAHRGQTDRAGQPYILHPAAVAANVETTEQKIVAYLHDVIEDTDITAEYLLDAGFPDFIVDAVTAITKADGMPYDEYLNQVKANDIARTVKIADLGHNLDESRLLHPTQRDIDRWEKYKKALKFMKEN